MCHSPVRRARARRPAARAGRAPRHREPDHAAPDDGYVEWSRCVRQKLRPSAGITRVRFRRSADLRSALSARVRAPVQLNPSAVLLPDLERVRAPTTPAEARLYLVCDERARAFLDAVLGGGVDIVQLRMKNSADEEILATAAVSPHLRRSRCLVHPQRPPGPGGPARRRRGARRPGRHRRSSGSRAHRADR